MANDVRPCSQVRDRLNAWIVLADGERGVLFDKNSLILKPLSQEIAEALGSMVASSKDLSDESSQQWKDMLEVIHGVDTLPALEDLSAAIPNDSLEPHSLSVDAKRLYKLAISVADTCNMACTYCYANQGLFDRPAGRLMSPNDAKTVADSAVSRFAAIDTVQFIGGEPSLNLPAIEQICTSFCRAVDAAKLPYLPRFVVTTNGANLTDRFFELAKSFGLLPTISLDGPSQIHDQLRRGRDGEPTYECIRTAIDRLLNAGLRVDFEATFTNMHVQHGLHLIDLCQWFRDEFGHRVLHAPPVSAGRYVSPSLVLSLDEKIHEYCAAAEWGVDNLLARNDWMADSFTARLLAAVAGKSRSSSICAAGHDLLCIAADGTAYPCWMFIGETDLRLGTFLDSSARTWDWTQTKELFAPGDLGSAACNACWTRALCFGCRGALLRKTGNLQDKADCDFVRAMSASVMMRIFHHSPRERSTAEYLSRPSYGEHLFVNSITDNR